MTDRNCNTQVASKQGSIRKPRTKYTTESFIMKANKVHGEKFNYSKTRYKTHSGVLIITCPNHGDFEQLAGNHLSGAGCKKCAVEIATKNQTSNTDEFIKKSQRKHGNRYLYDNSKYTMAKNKVTITCRVHGDFEQIAANHYNGQGCQLCSVKKRARSHKHSNDDFIKMAKNIHGKKYNYEKVDYKASNKDVKIICKYHGEFYQLPVHHIRGHGCSKCHYEASGYSRSDFKGFCDRGNNGIGELYVLKCYGNNELFYKIGITSTGVKVRFPSKRAMPYDFNTLYTIHGHPDYIYDIENRLHSLLKSVRHTPKLQFKGYTECFSTIRPVLKLLTELSGSKQIQLLA
ncbi:hypothetical protein [Psychrobacter sp.]|uniref:hypothetical protein n=1 Tax=Psychrobacter sp. TaxID=56811 RepID=UPI003C72D8A5